MSSFNNKQTVFRNSSIIFLLTFAYAVLRYNIFGNVPPEDIPTLIINKAVSFSMIVILPFVARGYFNNKTEDTTGYLNVFKVFTFIHVLLSFSILSQAYLPKLFTNEKLTLFGNISILAGVLATVYLFNKRVRVKSNLLYFLIATHLFFIGFKGWLEPEKWNGMMPPITLICFIIVAALFLLSVVKKSKQQANADKQD